MLWQTTHREYGGRDTAIYRNTFWNGTLRYSHRKNERDYEAPPNYRYSGNASHVKGLMNLHGEILCVVDVKILLNMGKIQMTEKGRIVVVKTREGLVGIFCDEVADIYDVLTKDIEPPLSTLSKEMDVSMKGQTQTRDGLMGILDIEKLLLTQEKSL